jgi:hypothetical protein
MGTGAGRGCYAERGFSLGGMPAGSSQRCRCSPSGMAAGSFFRRGGVPDSGGQPSTGAEPGGCGYSRTALDHS